jgi:hypothetical protein
MRELLLKERGPLCEHCGIRRWTDLHHCLVHDSKRLHVLVTVLVNLMCVCRKCHPYLNGHEVRVKFARLQIERGYDVVKWYQGLNLKSTEQWVLELEVL